MYDLILIGEFGEEMQDIDSQLKELSTRSGIPVEELVQAVCGSAPSGMSISEVDAAMRELSRCAAPVLRELSRCAAPVLRERKPRRMHPKRRPPRTREGFPWRWVVPQS